MAEEEESLARKAVGVMVEVRFLMSGAGSGQMHSMSFHLTLEPVSTATFRPASIVFTEGKTEELGERNIYTHTRTSRKKSEREQTGSTRK